MKPKPNAAVDNAVKDPISSKIMDILCDEQYLNRIKDMLFQTTLMEKFDELLQRFDNHATESEIAKEKIAKLEDKVSSLEEEVDKLE